MIGGFGGRLPLLLLFGNFGYKVWPMLELLEAADAAERPLLGVQMLWN